MDMLADGVIEPLRSKRQSIQSASETAIMLIRVDDMMITQQGGKPATLHLQCNFPNTDPPFFSMYSLHLSSDPRKCTDFPAEFR